MLQREIFQEGEGAAWLKRNANSLEKKPPGDAVIELVRNIRPRSVLEIGCSNGWRLQRLKSQGLCETAVGIDPSIEGRVKDSILLLNGTAESLPVHSNRFDCVIFGFCLYLVDPADYFKVVYEADRVLHDGGYLIIHDFRHGPYEAPHKNVYEHREGLFSHHADFGLFWKAHPAYRQGWTYIHEYSGCPIPKDEMITLLHKDMKGAFNALS